MTTQAAEWIRTTDPQTGWPVWQITNDSAPSEGLYFEAQAFTGDERYVVFRSRRTGVWLPYRCDLHSGQIVCLSDRAAVHYSMSMHLDGRHLYWVADGALWRIDVAALGEPELVYQKEPHLPGELVGSAMTFTNDGRYTAMSTTEPDRTVPIPDAYNQAEGHPSHLFRFDLERRKAEHVLTWEFGFSHPMICRGDPDLLTFVPDGAHCWNMNLPQSKRARTMAARVSTGKAGPFLTPLQQRTITHESWDPAGKRMFFFDKNNGTWVPVSICSVNRDGGDWQVHYTSYEHFLGHGGVSPDGRWFVSDAQKAHHSPLLLIDLIRGGAKILCWPNTSQEGGHAAAAHCHPSFSTRGNYITYTSDASGTPQVFVVPVNP